VQVFEPFGWIKTVDMTLDPLTGKHKGYCFVEYDTPEAAAAALHVLNGASLGARHYPTNTLLHNQRPRAHIAAATSRPAHGDRERERERSVGEATAMANVAAPRRRPGPHCVYSCMLLCGCCADGGDAGGRPLRVGRPTNFPADTPFFGLPPPFAERIYVANVHPDLSESDMQGVFEAFGTVRSRPPSSQADEGSAPPVHALTILLYGCLSVCLFVSVPMYACSAGGVRGHGARCSDPKAPHVWVHSVRGHCSRRRCRQRHERIRLGRQATYRHEGPPPPTPTPPPSSSSQP
jgi:hypothetical protein